MGPNEKESMWLTHALERRPVQASISGDRPMELHIAAAMKRPVEGLLIVARSQQAPTMRVRAKMVRKKKPLFLRRPWRTTRKIDRRRDGK